MIEDIKDAIMPTIMAGIEEKDGPCRDQAAKVIGILVARLGENAMAKQIEKLNKSQQAKMTETKDAYKPCKYDKSARKEAAKAKAAAKAPVKKPALSSGKSTAPKKAAVVVEE